MSRAVVINGLQELADLTVQPRGAPSNFQTSLLTTRSALSADLLRAQCRCRIIGLLLDQGWARSSRSIALSPVQVFATGAGSILNGVCARSKPLQISVQIESVSRVALLRKVLRIRAFEMRPVSQSGGCPGKAQARLREAQVRAAR